MPDELIIQVSQLPPVEYSPNWRGHWGARYKAGKVYQDAVYYEAVNARNKVDWEAVEYALMELEFVVAQERIRDEDNWRARFKPGQDSLVRADVILYDDLKHLVCTSLKFTVDKEKAPVSIIRILGKEKGGIKWL